MESQHLVHAQGDQPIKDVILSYRFWLLMYSLSPHFTTVADTTTLYQNISLDRYMMSIGRACEGSCYPFDGVPLRGGRQQVVGLKVVGIWPNNMAVRGLSEAFLEEEYFIS